MSFNWTSVQNSFSSPKTIIANDNILNKNKIHTNRQMVPVLLQLDVEYQRSSVLYVSPAVFSVRDTVVNVSVKRSWRTILTGTVSN